MDEKELVEYLMEGVTILKNIRDANTKVNQDIDNFLKRLADSASKDEKNKEEEQKKGGASAKTEEIGSDTGQKIKEMMEKLRGYQQERLGGSSPAIGPAFTATELMESLRKEAMKKQVEALKEIPQSPSSSLTAMAGASLIATPSISSTMPSQPPTPNQGSSTAMGTAIEAKEELPNSGNSTSRLPHKVIKLSKGKVTTASAPSAGAVESPAEVDASGFVPEGVFCAVHGKYHLPGEDV